MRKITYEAEKIAEVIENANRSLVNRELREMRGETEMIDSVCVLKAFRVYYETVVPGNKRGQTFGQVLSDIENNIGRGRHFLNLWWALRERRFDDIGYKRNPFAVIDYSDTALPLAIDAFRQAAVEIAIINAALKTLTGERFLKAFVKLKGFDFDDTEDIVKTVSDWLKLSTQFSELYGYQPE